MQKDVTTKEYFVQGLTGKIVVLMEIFFYKYFQSQKWAEELMKLRKDYADLTVNTSSRLELNIQVVPDSGM